MPRHWLLPAYFFVALASLGIFMPFASPWLLAQGLSGFEMSCVAATRPLSGILAPLAFGVLADRFGWRGTLMRWASLAAFVATALLALLAWQGPLRFIPILLGLGAFSFFRTPMMLLADVAALEAKTSYGGLRLWGSLGFLAAAVAAGQLMSVTRPAPLLLALAGSLLVAWLVSLGLPARAPQHVPPRAGSLRRLLAEPRLVVLLSVCAIWAASHGAYDLCLSLHLSHLGASSGEIGWAWGIAVAAEILLLAVSGKLLARVGLERCWRIGLAATALRWVLLSQLQSRPLLLWLQPLHALSFALVWTSSLELLKRLSPRELLATAQGLFSTALSLATTLGLLAWGPLFEQSGGHWVFGVAAVVGAVAALGSVTLDLKQPSWGALTASGVEAGEGSWLARTLRRTAAPPAP